MKTIEVENNKYELIKDYKNAFDLDEFISHYTDFFEDYDYLLLLLFLKQNFLL